MMIWLLVIGALCVLIGVVMHFPDDVMPPEDDR